MAEAGPGDGLGGPSTLVGHSGDDAAALLRERFGHDVPEFRVRAPGRVNLIGEHIDYSLLPVLPMAIQMHTSLALSGRSDGVVRLANVNPAYGDVELELSSDIDRRGEGDWGDYARGIAQELVRRYGLSRGADIVVASDVPVAAGLSSSSALSCAVALALVAVNAREVDALPLADLVARAERYTGTQGGGMDQAAILCARSGHALAVRFAPLRVRPIVVPDDWTFLVAPSGVSAEKSGSAQATYNARTRECREALTAVWGAVSEGVLPSGSDYRPLLERRTPDELLRVAERILDPLLLARFRHTVREAGRVQEAEKALTSGNRIAFGRLMNASHESLREDYEVSTRELDRVVRVAREAGARGARLTGAGLGGAALILCDEADATHVIDALTAEQTARAPGPASRPGTFSEGGASDAVGAFRVVPSAGAGLVGERPFG